MAGQKAAAQGRGSRKCLRVGGMLRAIWPVLMLSALPVLAEGSGGTKVPPRLVFNLSTGLNWSDNPDLSNPATGAGGRFDTGVGLAFNSATRTSSLALTLDGVLRAGGQGTAGSNGFKNPGVKLEYKIDTGNTRLGLSLTDRRAPVSLSAPATLPDGSVLSSDLVAVTGTVTTEQLGFRIETGITRPLALSLSGNYNGRTYSDTAATSVYDSHARSLQAGMDWRIDSLDTLSLTGAASATDYANASATRQRNRSLGLGYTRKLRPDLTLTTSLSEGTSTSNAFGIVAERSSGLSGSIGLTQDLPNGTASVTLDSKRDALGTRQSLSFGRALTLPTGRLDASLGLSARAGESPQAVGSLRWERTLPTDTFSVNLSRQVTLNADTVDQVSTVLGLTWAHRINDLSRLNLSFNLAETGGAGGGVVNGASRKTFTSTWSHDLVQDWQVSAGYTYRMLDQASTNPARSGTVFLTLNRKITLLP